MIFPIYFLFIQLIAKYFSINETFVDISKIIWPGGRFPQDDRRCIINPKLCKKSNLFNFEKFSISIFFNLGKNLTIVLSICMSLLAAIVLLSLLFFLKKTRYCSTNNFISLTYIGFVIALVLSL